MSTSIEHTLRTSVRAGQVTGPVSLAPSKAASRGGNGY
jgi:hypothetical protein